MTNQRKHYRAEAYLLLKPCDNNDGAGSNCLPSPELFMPAESKYSDVILRSTMTKVNLSESGIGFAYSTKHATGEILEIILLFPVRQHMWCALTVYGKVIRSIDKADNVFHLGVEFVGMSDGTRRQLWDFILNKQREALEIEKIRKTKTKQCLRASSVHN